MARPRSQSPRELRTESVDPADDDDVVASTNELDPNESDGGCAGPAGLVVLPIILAVVALLLIWRGPGSSDLWLVKGLVVALGGFLLAIGYRLIRLALLAFTLAQLTRDALGTASSIRNVVRGDPPSLAILHGHAEPNAATAGALPRAPLAGVACLAYALAIHRVEKNRGTREPRWEPLHLDERAAPFWLRDGTGRIMVDPTGADFGGEPAIRRSIDAADSVAIERLTRDLQTAGLSLDLTTSRRTLGFEIEEMIIPIGAHLSIVGPVVVRDGERIVGAGDGELPFSITTFDQAEMVPTVGGFARRMRGPAIIVPLAGAALLLGGFWWILTG